MCDHCIPLGESVPVYSLLSPGWGQKRCWQWGAPFFPSKGVFTLTRSQEYGVDLPGDQNKTPDLKVSVLVAHQVRKHHTWEFILDIPLKFGNITVTHFAQKKKKKATCEDLGSVDLSGQELSVFKFVESR